MSIVYTNSQRVHHLHRIAARCANRSAPFEGANEALGGVVLRRIIAAKRERCERGCDEQREPSTRSGASWACSVSPWGAAPGK